MRLALGNRVVFAKGLGVWQGPSLVALLQMEDTFDTENVSLFSDSLTVIAKFKCQSQHRNFMLDIDLLLIL